MSVIDKYLQTKHEEAAKSFDDGDTRRGKTDDAEIGAIHDLLQKIHDKLEKHFGDKEETDEEEIKEEE